MELGLCGYTVLIDDEDYNRVSSIDWNIMKSNKHSLIYFRKDYYTKYNNSKKRIHTTELLHRFIMNMSIGDGLKVDHINGNTLDNRKSNLRICHHAENIRNQKKRSDNTSGRKGVSWHKKAGKWEVHICRAGDKKYLGLYNDIEEAYSVYCKASKELHGEFGRIS